MATAIDSRAILCVDDEGIILMHLVMLLQNRYGPKFRYEKAASAERGLATLDQLYSQGIRVIVIVSDWLMPGIKGDEFLRQVYTKYPDIKAIMISGKVDAESLDDLADSTGLVGFLSKPIIPDELYRLVDRIITDPVAPPR